MFELVIESHNQPALIIREGIEKGNLWLCRGDGEGGDFSKEKILEVLNKFYNTNL